MQHFSIVLSWLHHLLSSSLEGPVALAEREPNISMMAALFIRICVEEATARHSRHTSVVDQVRHKIYLYCTAQRDILKCLSHFPKLMSLTILV